nr:vomeronasal type-1 receptor 90-like [Equus asinus]
MLLFTRKMNTNNEKLYTSIAIKNALFSQIVLGITANTILLLFHVHTLLLKHRPKPTDLTIGHLALIHIIMLLTMGFMVTESFGSQNFWNVVKCKSVIYLYRLTRSLSVCTTCLLSILQAIILSPRSSHLAKLKHKSSHHNLYRILLLRVFNMSINACCLISTIATLNVTSAHLLFVTESCSLLCLSYLPEYIFSTLGIFWDISFIGLMALSSGHMVTLLYRHKRQSRHLHSTNLSPKASPEERATHTILLFLSVFVFVYFLDYITSVSLEMWWNNDSVRQHVHVLVTNSYTTVSPLVLISTEKRIMKVLKSVCGRTVNA